MVKYGPLHYKALQADTCAALQINNIIYNDNAIISPQAIKELNWYVSIIQLAYHYLNKHYQTGTLCTKASMLHAFGAEIQDSTTGGWWSSTDLSTFTQVNLGLSLSVPIMWYPHLIEDGRHHRHINNMNGSKFFICNSIPKEIWRCDTVKNIWMGAEHLAGTKTCCGW